MSCKLLPPKAPSDQLRLDSFRVLSRLRIITELRPWVGRYANSKPDASFRVLWECFSLGAPLCTLLNMLAPPYLDVDVDFDLPLDRRLSLFTNFIERVRLLEMQNRLAYGEVLRVDDLFGATNSGFAKVLKTVQRVLAALEDSYPGLYVLPPRWQQQRTAFVQNLLDTEEVHVSALGMVAEAALLMSEATGTIEPRLECLLVHRSHLRQYHSQVLTGLQQIAPAPWLEEWTKIFGTTQTSFVTRTVSAYRSICVNYLPVHDFLLGQLSTLKPELRVHAQALLDIVGRIPSRLSEYCAILTAIMHVSTPSVHHSYDTLCALIFAMQGASDTIDEMSRQIRTMRAASIFQARAFGWDLPIDTGCLLIDDVLCTSDAEAPYNVFLFENVLLCCFEETSAEQRTARYPIHPWELGLALRGTSPLCLPRIVPLKALTAVRVFGLEAFAIEWADDNGRENVIEFTSLCAVQNEQWCSLLGLFAPTIHECDTECNSILSVDSSPTGRRKSYSRPWSVRGHKTTHSESSSLVKQDFVGNNEIHLSPGLLPTLFGGIPDLPRSPLSLDTTFQSVDPGFQPPPTPPPEFVPVGENNELLLDLTGKVTKQGRFAEAGGGFSDVWAGIWRDGLQERRVAVKVLRSRLDDPETERKMQQRLARELAVWKKMDHPHILPLYGIVSDFGRYDSMVCPWFENGSVTKYMERRGDLLSMTDRLQLLIDVAHGLNYLHSLDIVHGDLTGSNILVNDKGQAVLCDFGLSSILAEFQGQSCVTSNIGGAVRWADAALFRYTQNNDVDNDEPPLVTPLSDIYSFGSVTLEILSGRIPYHYVRSDAQVIIELHRGNKPRRPAVTFVADAQWNFIQECWSDDLMSRPDAPGVLATVQALHRASLEFRRRSAP
ncbi:kinase-like protein [Hymenopellis radicata]|nr:kinase-like protein [Hymenopellis radicata]